MKKKTKKKTALDLIIQDLLKQHGLGVKLHSCAVYNELQAWEPHHKGNLHELLFSENKNEKN